MLHFILNRLSIMSYNSRITATLCKIFTAAKMDSNKLLLDSIVTNETKQLNAKLSTPNIINKYQKIKD